MKPAPSSPLRDRIAAVRQWIFEPRSTDRDRAFRERVIRNSLAIAIVGALLSLLSSIFLYQSELTLLSFPSLHVVVLLLLLASVLAVYRGHLLISGWLLVIAVLAGSSGIVLLARQSGVLGTILIGFAPFTVIPLIAVSVLPRSMIIPVSILCALVYGVSQFSVQIGTLVLEGVLAEQQVTSISIILIIEGLLLRQLRAEFDARLAVMRSSMQETELAKQQAEADRQRAEQADKAKSQFLASMSHELRTPLNAIIGYDEAMLAGMVGNLSAKQIEVLGHVQKNSRRLLGLINDILDLAKIESEKVELYIGSLSPQKVISETVQSLEGLASEKGIGLEMTFAENLPDLIMGDVKKIEQVLVNLLSNAVKFTDAGRVSIQAASVNEAMWRFSIQDTGIGMSREALNLIFDPFRQVDDSLTRRHRGTGLGLSITKHLVERMGGSITVASVPGEGSVFTVYLPTQITP